MVVVAVKEDVQAALASGTALRSSHASRYHQPLSALQHGNGKH